MTVKRVAMMTLSSAAMAGGAWLAGATAASASASAPSSNSCSAQGSYAVCDADATFSHPVTLTVTVSASPDQQVSVYWTDTCDYGSGAGSNSGSFTATTPVSRTITHPYSQPDSCIVAASAQLSGAGDLTVSLSSSATAPSSHEIKGYDAKCADDNGNSSADRAKVQIWSCVNDASQQWSFSGGELKHGSMCMNDSGNAGNGGHVILWTCNGAANEIWQHTSSNEYVLKSKGLCLDDPAYSTRNGTQLEVYHCHNGSNQHWSLP
jgi:hypothetical protein